MRCIFSQSLPRFPYLFLRSPARDSLWMLWMPPTSRVRQRSMTRRFDPAAESVTYLPPAIGRRHHVLIPSSSSPHPPPVPVPFLPPPPVPSSSCARSLPLSLSPAIRAESGSSYPARWSVQIAVAAFFLPDFWSVCDLYPCGQGRMKAVDDGKRDGFYTTRGRTMEG